MAMFGGGAVKMQDRNPVMALAPWSRVFLPMLCLDDIHSQKRSRTVALILILGFSKKEKEWGGV